MADKRTRTKTCEAPDCGVTIDSSKTGHYRWGNTAGTVRHGSVDQGRRRIGTGDDSFIARFYVCSKKCYTSRLAQLESGVNVHSKNTFAGFVAEPSETAPGGVWWTDDMPKGKNGQKVDDSALTIRRAKARHWATVLGDTKFNDLNARDMIADQDQMVANNRSASTINQYRKILRMILHKAAYKYDLLEPRLFVKWFEGDSPLVPVLKDLDTEVVQDSYEPRDREELTRMKMERPNEFALYLASNLSAYFGGRNGEMFGLMWGDFYPSIENPEYVHIQRQLTEANKLKLPKGGKKRWVKVIHPPTVARFLQEAKQYQEDLKMEWEWNQKGSYDDEWHMPEFQGESGLVLTRPDGDAVRRKAVTNSFPDEMERLEITWRRRVGTKEGHAIYDEATPVFHGLRYTYVTDLTYDYQVPVEIVQQFAGHSHKTMTRKYIDHSRGLPGQLPPELVERINQPHFGQEAAGA